LYIDESDHAGRNRSLLAKKGIKAKDFSNAKDNGPKAIPEWPDKAWKNNKIEMSSSNNQ
jgi:hypothetical protein